MPTFDPNYIICNTGKGSIIIILCCVHFSTEPVVIEPEIPNFDISTYHIGDTVTIGCPVSTCADDVNVTFLSEDDKVRSGILADSQNMVYNLDLTIMDDSAGMYACRVSINGSDIMQMFNVTGVCVCVCVCVCV